MHCRYLKITNHSCMILPLLARLTFIMMRNLSKWICSVPEKNLRRKGHFSAKMKWISRQVGLWPIIRFVPFCVAENNHFQKRERGGQRDLLTQRIEPTEWIRHKKRATMPKARFQMSAIFCFAERRTKENQKKWYLCTNQPLCGSSHFLVTLIFCGNSFYEAQSRHEQNHPLGQRSTLNNRQPSSSASIHTSARY